MPPNDGAAGVSAVVLAAGAGSRLRDAAPVKPLVEVDGRPLIQHVLAALGEAGVKRAYIVTGHSAEILAVRLDEMSAQLPLTLEIIVNPDFHLSNGISVLAAKSHAKQPFILTMADHLFDPEIVRLLLANGLGDNALVLAVDRRIENPDVDLEDVTRVATKNGRILRIGKGLAEFDAFDTGLFYATPALFEALARIREEKGDASLSNGVQRLADEGRAAVLDIGARFWLDVDDAAMLARAGNYATKYSRR